ncbi:MAG: phytochromobilin:ferredoxin oxidoreductase [Desulfobacterota bacterium]|nr:phytochromobilin:ferredoxin oxidoreductase [Thermodesulfobacteriota bacterium]
MDTLLSQALDIIGKKTPLSPCELPQELAETKFILNVLTLRCFNWKSDILRKVYAMRMTVKVPSMDIIGMAFYPHTFYDLPIFAFDLTCTSKKVIAYINPVAVVQGEAYRQRFIEPFKPVYEKCGDFQPHKVPEWMQKYNNSCTIYTMPERDRLDDLKACAVGYLQVYAELLATAQPVAETAQRSAIEAFHAAYIRDLTTKDRSQVMLAKIIGKQKAARIFNEVLV